MTDPAPDPMTAARMAQALGVPEARVKAALQRLGLEPSVRKGCHRYYSDQTFQRLREALKG
jgi:hypothetical protein